MLIVVEIRKSSIASLEGFSRSSSRGKASLRRKGEKLRESFINASNSHPRTAQRNFSVNRGFSFAWSAKSPPHAPRISKSISLSEITQPHHSLTTVAKRKICCRRRTFFPFEMKLFETWTFTAVFVNVLLHGFSLLCYSFIPCYVFADKMPVEKRDSIISDKKISPNGQGLYFPFHSLKSKKKILKNANGKAPRKMKRKTCFWGKKAKRVK